MIRQRFLYVGIGGSGLDIGRELTEALTREICGLDGRRLQARGGAFAGFKRKELPKFVQSVYLDFSQSALDEIICRAKTQPQFTPFCRPLLRFAKRLIICVMRMFLMSMNGSLTTLQ